MVHSLEDRIENCGDTTVTNYTGKKNNNDNIDDVEVGDESLPEKDYDNDYTVNDNTVDNN